MVVSTPNYGFPYPTMTDPPDGPGQLQALAEAVESKLTDVDSAASSLDTRVTGTEGRLGTLETGTAIGAWSNLTLLNGWTPRSGFPAPAYRRLPGNNLQVKGTIIGGTKTNGTDVALLPYASAAGDTFIMGSTNGGEAIGFVLHSSGYLSLFYTNVVNSFTAVNLGGIFSLD